MPPCSTAINLSAADAISAVLAVNVCYKCCFLLLPIIQLVWVFLSGALAVNTRLAYKKLVLHLKINKCVPENN